VCMMLGALDCMGEAMYVPGGLKNFRGPWAPARALPKFVRLERDAGAGRSRLGGGVVLGLTPPEAIF
jgi:hypothetical protein